ncbi:MULTISPECIES: hypothetical protein [unclassified Streptomyces]|uniref:hypothetical protein n=1 Tax=unclassified Streptomyces TaxID=2593676 RepID=UPI0004C0CD9B|nr:MULTISPECIES: hypothetical protein [unclassified Streptomyces]
MASHHDIDPRNAGRRDIRPTDEEFYASDRPENPALPEDRPRGGEPRDAVQHRATWSTVLIVIAVIVVIFAGIWFFP